MSFFFFRQSVRVVKHKKNAVLPSIPEATEEEKEEAALNFIECL